MCCRLWGILFLFRSSIVPCCWRYWKWRQWVEVCPPHLAGGVLHLDLPRWHWFGVPAVFLDHSTGGLEQWQVISLGCWMDSQWGSCYCLFLSAVLWSFTVTFQTRIRQTYCSSSHPIGFKRSKFHIFCSFGIVALLGPMVAVNMCSHVGAIDHDICTCGHSVLMGTNRQSVARGCCIDLEANWLERRTSSWEWWFHKVSLPGRFCS